MSKIEGEYFALPLDEGAGLPEQKFKLNYRKLRIYLFSYAWTLYLLSLHFTLVALVILRVLDWKAGSQTGRLLPLELPFAEKATNYETVTFDPSGFWEDPREATPFEGEPNAENNAMWDHITNVGIYSLTAEEYKAQDLETAQVVGDKDQYIVTIEMFHQLHCLNYLRQRLYNSGQHHMESEQSKPKHLAHCIDYLRQVLMCHGDLTPISLISNTTRHPPYSPNFRIKHTCRNFDQIWEFAAKRNISGLTIE